MSEALALVLKTMEDGFARQNRLISDLGGRTVDLAKELQVLNGERLSTDRLLMALAALVAQKEGDPLAFCEQLRAMALDPIPIGDTRGFEAGRESLERALTKIETFVLASKPG